MRCEYVDLCQTLNPETKNPPKVPKSATCIGINPQCIFMDLQGEENNSVNVINSKSIWLLCL